MVAPYRYALTRPEVSVQDTVGSIIQDRRQQQLLGLQQQQAELAQAEEARRQQAFESQQVAADQARQLDRKYQRLAASRDRVGLINFVRQNPRYAEATIKAQNFANEQEEQLVTSGAIRIDQLDKLGDKEGVLNAVDQLSQSVKSAGGNPAEYVAFAKAYQENPDSARPSLNALLAATPAGQQYIESLGRDEGVADLPAEAVAFNELIKDFTPEQQKAAKLVKAGLKGRAISNAELSAIASGEIETLSDWRKTMKQEQKFAELTGSSRAKAIDKGFERISKINEGIRNIDRAIGALDKGAGVGAIERLLPSIKAASVELDNIRGSMALDVVGATTFGALSKGELDLAKDVALPTGLDSAQLKDYLIRKRSAQEKLKNYYNEQIQFLDQGGTVAGFLRSKGYDSPQNQPAEELPETEGAPTIEELLEKYG